MADLENEVIAEAVRDGQKPVVLENGKRYAWLVNGSVVTEDLTEHAPPFKTGTVTVRDVASFEHYFTKHGYDDSEVYADLERGTVTGIIDAHGRDYAAWQKHRLVLALQPTKSWLTWTSADGVPMGQSLFAEFLEDNYPDVRSPDAADLKEIVRKFQATVTTSVKSHQRPESGTITFVFDENVTALGGRELDIPSELVLAIKPYDDCDDMTIKAKLRYKVLADGDVQWHFVLDRPAQVAEQAIKDVVDKVARAIGDQIEPEPGDDAFAVEGLVTPRTIMLGTPSS